MTYTTTYTTDMAAAYQQHRRPDPHITAQLRDIIAPVPAGTYLDIGCGTGSYTAALAAPEAAANSGTWHGLDPSAAMLAQARTAHHAIHWHQGRAEALPFANGHFDGAVSVLALHHFADMPQAFREAARILRPGGKLALFTATRAQTESFWLKDYFPKMMARDAEALPPLATLENALAESGFDEVQHRPFSVSVQTQDRFFFIGDVMPEIYLSADARAAMSVFRHATDDELAEGLDRLEADLQAGGRIPKSQATGHYMFIEATAS